nr:immunoglobulin heavy chain junction region [Macaca mulatta]MOY21915.1 immunoglobulin heavy chain junction region [Macaca mulatta]MOY22111.1 immunoglobulin heavy chain junction region [Macaca mulatta]MOY23141.1 immunoglobulin heavy chain junction region [Macaca mulatta]MOY23436.1 immunoglobulin heavy chain junction region [Macaca mulatta]
CAILGLIADYFDYW